MYLLIDNYDSFTYNLWHFLGELGAEVEVVRNDALTAEQALAKAPQGLLRPFERRRRTDQRPSYNFV